MFVSKLIIAAVLLCILLSLFSNGLLSAALDLGAFVLLVIHYFRAPKTQQLHD